MTDSDIKLFFDVYFNNFITSISWDEQIHAPAAKEEWIRCLKNCGRSRYQLCIEDDLLFHSFFTHLKEDKSTLSNSQCSRSKFLSYFLIFFVKNFHITLFHFTEKRSYFFVVKQRFKEILYTDRG